MNFIDPAFVITFLVAFPAYLIFVVARAPVRYQNRLLLATSYFFYGWFDWRFVFLLFFTTCVDYYAAIVIDHYQRHKKDGDGVDIARLTVILSIVANLAVLGYFKYFNFFIDSFYTMAGEFGFQGEHGFAEVLLPIGISFYTFQSMGYVLEVYDRRLKPTTGFTDFALFVSFFPHLVSGPILRAHYFMPQILNPRRITLDNFISGFQLALWGYVTKVVVADNMALIVNPIFKNPNSSGTELIVATYAFALQIYCDFMGYTNIARGISRMMGFELAINFRLPYFARNPSEFWRRWHISLSTWLRDFLYIRLGGNRGGGTRTSANMLITMVLGGLWHGAAWNFVLWGAYHGLLLAIFRRFAARATLDPGAGPVHWLKVFGYFHLTCFGWLMFRAEGYDDFAHKLETIVNFTEIQGFWNVEFGLVLAFAVPLFLFEYYQYRRDDLEPWRTWPPIVRIGWAALLLTLLAVYKAPFQSPFIYFQF